MKEKLLVICSFLILSFYSCAPDACEDVNCLNGGTCETGNCVCEPGYEGFNCETEQRLAFLGEYTVSESCNLGSFNYQISIAADSNFGTSIVLNNLADLDFDIIGSVAGTGVTFTGQTSTGATVIGTGELTGSTLTMDYTLITANSDTLICSLTGVLNQ